MQSRWRVFDEVTIPSLFNTRCRGTLWICIDSSSRILLETSRICWLKIRNKIMKKGKRGRNNKTYLVMSASSFPGPSKFPPDGRLRSRTDGPAKQKRKTKGEIEEALKGNLNYQQNLQVWTSTSVTSTTGKLDASAATSRSWPASATVTESTVGSANLGPAVSTCLESE